MRLSAKVRREQLISAAMRLFALQGFDGTTTREIAQAADIIDVAADDVDGAEEDTELEDVDLGEGRGGELALDCGGEMKR